MATEHNDDALRNPQVDYERGDLSARGILLFLLGLLVCGIFIELVVWGMFRFLAKSDVLFPSTPANAMLMKMRKPPQGQPNPSHLQNIPQVNMDVFPEPRLQTGDARDMDKFLTSERGQLNPQEPFKDASGTIHLPIADAMKLIEQRGLPVRPNAPPPEVTTQTESGNTKVLEEQTQSAPQPLGRTQSEPTKDVSPR